MSEKVRPQFQWSLRALLILVAACGVLFGLIATGWYAVVFFLLVGGSVVLMARDIYSRPTNRRTAIVTLIAAASYAAANVGVFWITIARDAFAIFEVVYIALAVLVIPGIMIFASIIVAKRTRRLRWTGLLGFAIWVGCVAFAHLWVIVQCSASV